MSLMIIPSRHDNSIPSYDMVSSVLLGLLQHAIPKVIAGRIIHRPHGFRYQGPRKLINSILTIQRLLIINVLIGLTNKMTSEGIA